MASAILDLTINEGDTFILAMEFWENVDNTIPDDITLDTFNGQFRIGEKFIPMVATKSLIAINVVEFKVDALSMKELSKKGAYDIDQIRGGETFRILQGVVRIDKEVTA